jgi:hypothetical protein
MTRTRFSSRLALLSIALAALASCRVADAAPPDTPQLSVEYYQADSARVIARWNRPCDGKGCVEGYDVKWTVGAVVGATKRTLALADTIRAKRPTYGDSLLTAVTITTVRRSLKGQERWASIYVYNPDSPPPPVDTLKVDTIPRADSTKLAWFTSTGVALAGAWTVAEHDSVLVVQRKWFPAGTIRRDRSMWSATGSPVMRVTAIDARGDSAWLVALSCNCAESGSPNPPRLDVRNGSYAVRNAAGNWTPVRPLSADPFTR